MRLIPDRRLTNADVESFATGLHSLYKPLIERMNRTGWRIDVAPQNYVVLEWHLAPNKAEVMLHTPSHTRTIVEQHINTTWPRVTTEDIEHDPLNDWLSNISGADLHLREHYMYAIHVDRRSLAPISTILETLRMLQEGERGLIQMILVQADKDWSEGAKAAYDKLKDGGQPKRIGVDGRSIAEGIAKFGAGIALHTSALVAEIITGKEIEPEPVDLPSKLYLDRTLSSATLQKTKYAAFDVTIRVASMSHDPGRREVILNALSTAFRDLDKDNGFLAKPIKNMSKWWLSVVNRKPPRLKINADYLSIPEVARLLQLPTGQLQEEYGLSSVQHRESDLPVSVLSGGIQIGEHTFRGESESVYIPIHDHDELCLPRIVIGGMGTGKTRGFGGNFGAQAIAHGFSVISIDVAKDELGAEIEIGAKRRGVPDDKIIHLKFGEKAYRLDWIEGMLGKRAANRLAGEVLNFFNLHSADAGVETSRYIRLAGKTVGVLGGTLSDIFDMFRSEEYREDMIKRLKEKDRTDIASEWETYEKLSPGMKGKVMEPVLNRLDMLQGDDYLRECLEVGESLDFRKWLTGGYHVRIHVPKGGIDGLGAEAVDILVDFLMAKIELAMFARPEEEQAPCFVIMDEPHQFKSCSARWERMAVETRKWRLGLIWMFHLWDQVPRKLTETIKAAGPHYHIYTTSKNILRDLAEEIAPFTVEEAMKTPRHYAINVIRAGGVTVTPFMAKMTPPPSAIE
ncbi:hypothetical protein DNHGIG_00820 [Collibacillus ludicampi]|uniref:ATP-binding protein n=1 Tax=Collibacillus ludicampi TaxID=2771369 RepID=A0AAV4LA19_9BACL|nr:hypothetical protein [Collibacillus ludicampi]GIM44533.1 hypothetical protein DNHGIG_00820 [Collibacillus ludicampi]